MREMYIEELYEDEKISSCWGVSVFALGSGIDLTDLCTRDTEAF